MKKQVKTIKPVYLTLSYVLLGLLLAAAPLQAKDQEIIVRIENLGPEGGVYFTPVWMGFHDGSFDLFDPGGLASEALERLAEDGDASALRMEFEAAVGGATGGIDEVVTAPAGFAGAPVFDPGDAASMQLTVDSEMNRYMSFVSMIIPSNDAFIGNHNPQGIELFDAAGNFKGKQVTTILGSMVWDAGTELNTEMDAAFINQADPDTGVTTACPVLPHSGYLGSYANQGSDPIILGGTGPADIEFDSSAADFTLPHAVVARITIEPVPAAEAMTMSAAALLAQGRGDGPVIYVTGQGLFYDSIVKADLPMEGPFQLLEAGGPSGLQTEFGPGDVGYVGGRWWVDVTGDGEQNEGDGFFMCPLLPPGRVSP
ncbi:MAG: spondin domain-containing protein [Planctomycetota bacterium]|jgi:hypothetical protein